jgi:hypothetical protein
MTPSPCLVDNPIQVDGTKCSLYCPGVLFNMAKEAYFFEMHPGGLVRNQRAEVKGQRSGFQKSETVYQRSEVRLPEIKRSGGITHHTLLFIQS